MEIHPSIRGAQTRFVDQDPAEAIRKSTKEERALREVIQTFQAHLAEPLPPAPKVELESAAEVNELTTKGKDLVGRLAPLLAERDEKQSALNAELQAAIAAVPGYTGAKAAARSLTTSRGKLDEVEKGLAHYEGIRDDWARTKGSRAWQKSNNVAWQAYYHDETMAEVTAPAKIRDLRAQQAELLREVGRGEGRAEQFDSIDREQVAPIRRAFAERAEHEYGELDKRIAALNTELSGMADRVIELARAELAAVGFKRTLSSVHRYRAVSSFDRAIPHSYPSTLGIISSRLDYAGRLADSLKSLGNKKDDRAVYARKNHKARINTELAGIEREALLERLPAKAKNYVKGKAYWDAVADMVNGFFEAVPEARRAPSTSS